MDAVKPADSLDLFVSKPSPKHKFRSDSAAHSDQSHPSSFARMLEKTSQNPRSKVAAAPSTTAQTDVPERHAERANPASVQVAQAETSSVSVVPEEPTSDDSDTVSISNDPEVVSGEPGGASSQPPQTAETATTSIAIPEFNGQFPIDDAPDDAFDAISEEKPSLSDVAFPQLNPALSSLAEPTPELWDENFPLEHSQPGLATTEIGEQAGTESVSTPEGDLQILSPEIGETQIPDALINPSGPADPPRETAQETNRLEFVPNLDERSRVPENPHRLHNFTPDPRAFEHSDAVNRLSSFNPLEFPHLPQGGSSTSVAEETAPLPNVSAQEVPPSPTVKPLDGQNSSNTQQANPPQNSPAVERNSGPSLEATSSRGDRAEPEPAETLVDRMGTKVMQAANGGKVMRMRLHPPELGVLQIEVTSTEGTVTARLDVENARAHRAILDNLPHLHDMLNRTGSQIDRIELNILESQAGLESHSNHSGDFSSDRNPSEHPVSPNESLGIEETDSSPDPNSVRNFRQTQDWRSRSNALSGIDIQV
jgi:hypothetical protein